MTNLAYFIYVIFIFSAQHLYLCMTTIVWFVIREQMLIHMMLRTLRWQSED